MLKIKSRFLFGGAFALFFAAIVYILMATSSTASSNYEELFRLTISPDRTLPQFQSLCNKYNVSSVDVCNSRDWGRFLRFEIDGKVYCVTRIGHLLKYKNNDLMKKCMDFTMEQNLYGRGGSNADSVFWAWNEASQH